MKNSRAQAISDNLYMLIGHWPSITVQHAPEERGRSIILRAMECIV
jgi:hypothetical protein